MKTTTTKSNYENEDYSPNLLLSDLSSLLHQPWVPRLQIVASREAESKSEAEAFFCDESNVCYYCDSPLENYLVSSSPLVPWHSANCTTTEWSPEVFTFTPPPLSVVYSAIMKQPTPGKPPSLSIVAKGETNYEDGSPVSPKSDNSLLAIMTSCLKMSPPRSCVLLEPETCHLGKVRESTPFSVGSEEWPVWISSPPKTCILGGALDEKSLEQDYKLIYDLSKDHNQGNFVGNLSPIESTPIWLEPESSLQTGKCPSESTLKEELWTKFEAASTCGFDKKADSQIKQLFR